jgi:acetamidase/formamidase
MGMVMPGREHVIDPALIHHEWDAGLEPALVVSSGDVVHYDLKAAGADQVWPGATYPECKFDFDTIYNLSGPVWIDGAGPGDTLEIEILALTPGSWGWTAFMPGLGLLPEDFPQPFVKTFDLRNGRNVDVCPQVTVPLAPFLGTMGTQPDTPPSAPSFPPHKGGGNIDTRHLTAGSILWLPVWCAGALFSCGDPHGAQGDGEVCLAALECDMRARLRFTVEPRTIARPRFQTTGALTPLVDERGHRGSMGIGPDLMQGARDAVRDTIGWLVEEHGLTREDAYVTCSLAGDLKLLEVVDGGIWNVGFTLPLSVLRGRV